MACAEPRKSPTPIVPPKAMSWIWRLRRLRDRCDSDCDMRTPLAACSARAPEACDLTWTRRRPSQASYDAHANLPRGLQTYGQVPRRAPERSRCGWVPAVDVDYTRYHDEEWGRPVHDDRHLFEMLTLEGAQAGLSWATILRKRAAYRKAFAGFIPAKVARFDARRRAALLRDPGIVRNRLKVDSTVSNARGFLAVQKEFGSFSAYLWDWVGGQPGHERLADPRPSARQH